MNKFFTFLLNLSKIIPTKLYLKLIYRKKFDKKLDLKNPKTFNEKLQWKKIYDKNPFYTTCADKYSVRKIIKKRIGKEYLIPLLAHTNNITKIDFDKLPLPFVIKSNNGSGKIIIIKSKKELNKKEISNKCKKWLNYNYYPLWREPQYKNIKPSIIIERLLIDEDGKIPKDYKFHCFNGNVEFIEVHTDRFGDHKKTAFDKNWKLIPFILCGKKADKPIYKIKRNIPRPKNLKKMINIAEKLSKDFDYVRVDLYSIYNKIYFGELTFHPGSGFLSFFPEKYDLIWGKRLKLKVLGKV